MIWIGIDPGLSGGIAQIDNGEVSLCKMPETEWDIGQIVSEFGRCQQFGSPTIAYIEKVHSMPDQGVASSFKFGMNYGFLRGLLVAYQIPFEEVSPQKWQKFMNCMTHGDKNISKARAQQLYPKLKITHATADALLIAHYCMVTHQVGMHSGWNDL